MLATMHVILLSACACLTFARPDNGGFAVRDQSATSTQPSSSTSALPTPKNNILLPPTPFTEYLTRARQSVDLLQNSFYDTSNGLYNKLWWNSANALTTLADLAALDPTLQPIAAKAYETTFLHAQEYNLGIQSWILRGHPIPPGIATNGIGFLNKYYDDEGWWAWAWLKAYDQTEHPPYLNAAITIFNDQVKGYHASCGALLWSKKSDYNAAIANELFLFVSAALANRVPAAERAPYLSWAQREWAWFEASGLINSDNLINDGLNGTTCKNDNFPVYTYNQGVILAGLVELHKATTGTNSSSPSSYLTKALTLARASITSPLLTTTAGILREKCDPGCTGDAQQFKGPFMRGLVMLQQALPGEEAETREELKAFIERNAESVWASRGPRGELSSSWAGVKWDGVKSVQAQSAGGDALVAAAVVAGKWG